MSDAQSTIRTEEILLCLSSVSLFHQTNGDYVRRERDVLRQSHQRYVVIEGLAREVRVSDHFGYFGDDLRLFSGGLVVFAQLDLDGRLGTRFEAMSSC